MPIKGVPTDAARPMADLIVAGEHTVASRGLARQQVADLTLFALAAGNYIMLFIKRKDDRKKQT